MDTQTVKLSAPVELRMGETTDTLTIRKPTIGDEEDAMDMAIAIGKPDNRITLEICTYAAITGLKYDTIRSLPAEDFVKIRMAYNRILGPLVAKMNASESV